MKIPKELQAHYTPVQKKTKSKNSPSKRSIEHITSSTVPSFFNKHISPHLAETKSLKGRVTSNTKPTNQDEI